MDEFKDAVLNKYATFSGRASQRDYWMFVLLQTVILIGLMILASTIGTVGAIIYVLALLGLILPGIAVGVRRLHDVDKSGWWMLISIVPFGAFYLLYLLIIEGTPDDNRFGSAKISKIANQV